MEQVVRKFKHDRMLEFKKKGHKSQFLFNDDVKDQMESATTSSAVFWLILFPQPDRPVTFAKDMITQSCSKCLEHSTELAVGPSQLVR